MKVCKAKNPEQTHIRVFKQSFKEAYRYYIMGVANLELLLSSLNTMVLQA